MERKDDFKTQADLIIKYLTDSLSAQEQASFELWLNQSPENRDLVESFRDTSNIQAEINHIHAIDVDDAWQKVNNQIRPKAAKLFSTTNIIRYGAAVLVLGFAFGAYWYPHKSSVTKIAVKQQVAYIIPAGKKKAVFELADGKVINLNDRDVELKSAAVSVKNGTLFFAKNVDAKGNMIVRTPKGGEYKMVLADGTNVWLNASSSLSFSNNFNKNERRVSIKGEAYFEVAHDKNRPFTVSFNNTEVEVLGTHFNVNSYEKESKTTLLEGMVKISEGANRKMLKPGQEATVTDKGIAVTQVETYKSIAWKEGLFLFEEEVMTDVLAQVARWYDVKIKYDGKPSEKKYSGNIRRQANLNQVLEMLTAVSGNKFSLADRTVTVKF